MARDRGTGRAPSVRVPAFSSPPSRSRERQRDKPWEGPNPLVERKVQNSLRRQREQRASIARRIAVNNLNTATVRPGQEPRRRGRTAVSKFLDYVWQDPTPTGRKDRMGGAVTEAHSGLGLGGMVKALDPRKTIPEALDMVRHPIRTLEQGWNPEPGSLQIGQINPPGGVFLPKIRPQGKRKNSAIKHGRYSTEAKQSDIARAIEAVPTNERSTPDFAYAKRIQRALDEIDPDKVLGRPAHELRWEEMVAHPYSVFHATPKRAGAGSLYQGIHAGTLKAAVDRTGLGHSRRYYNPATNDKLPTKSRVRLEPMWLQGHARSWGDKPIRDLGEWDDLYAPINRTVLDHLNLRPGSDLTYRNHMPLILQGLDEVYARGRAFEKTGDVDVAHNDQLAMLLSRESRFPRHRGWRYVNDYEDSGSISYTTPDPRMMPTHQQMIVEAVRHGLDASRALESYPALRRALPEMQRRKSVRFSMAKPHFEEPKPMSNSLKTVQSAFERIDKGVERQGLVRDARALHRIAGERGDPWPLLDMKVGGKRLEDKMLEDGVLSTRMDRTVLTDERAFELIDYGLDRILRRNRGRNPLREASYDNPADFWSSFHAPEHSPGESYSHPGTQANNTNLAIHYGDDIEPPHMRGDEDDFDLSDLDDDFFEPTGTPGWHQADVLKEQIDTIFFNLDGQTYTHWLSAGANLTSKHGIKAVAKEALGMALKKGAITEDQAAKMYLELEAL